MANYTIGVSHWYNPSFFSYTIQFFIYSGGTNVYSPYAAGETFDGVGGSSGNPLYFNPGDTVTFVEENSSLTTKRIDANLVIRPLDGVFTDDTPFTFTSGGTNNVTRTVGTVAGVGQIFAQSDPNTVFFGGATKYLYTGVAGDSVPDQFTFTDTINESPNSIITKSIVVSGLGTGNKTKFSVIGDGQIKLNSGSYIGPDGGYLLAQNGDTITLLQTAPPSYGSTNLVTVVAKDLNEIDYSVLNITRVTTVASPSGEDYGLQIRNSSNNLVVDTTSRQGRFVDTKTGSIDLVNSTGSVQLLSSSFAYSDITGLQNTDDWIIFSGVAITNTVVSLIYAYYSNVTFDKSPNTVTVNFEANVPANSTTTLYYNFQVLKGA